MNEKEADQMEKLFLRATSEKLIKTSQSQFGELQELLVGDLQVFNFMKLVRNYLFLENQ